MGMNVIRALKILKFLVVIYPWKESESVTGK